MSEKTDWQWVAQNPKEAAALIDRLDASYRATVQDFNDISDDSWKLKQHWMQVETLAFELCQIDDNANLHKLRDLIESVHRKPKGKKGKAG